MAVVGATVFSWQSVITISAITDLRFRVKATGELGKSSPWAVAAAISVSAIAAGRGVQSIEPADGGGITITYTDGTTDTFNIAAGRGIQSISRDPDTGVVTFTYTDNTTAEIEVPSGDGIASISRNDVTGIVTVILDSGATRTFTVMDGAPGGLTEWIYIATQTDMAPAVPVATDPTRMMTDDVPAGWNDNPVAGSFVWVSSRSREFATEAFSLYSAPQKFRGDPGISAAFFLQPVIDIPVRIIGDTISQSTGFDPNPTSTIITLNNAGTEIPVEVRGNVTANGVTVTLAGDNSDQFEVLT